MANGSTIKKVVCPICGRNMLLLKYRRRLFWTVPITCGDCEYYKCNYCGHVILGIPDNMNIEYQANYRINMSLIGDIADGELTSTYYLNRVNILNNRVKITDGFIKGGASIFEIGCGGGYMLKYYKDKGYIVSGVEIDDLCVKACKKMDIDCLKGNFLDVTVNQQYDVVMAWHCMEHILDVNAFLRKMVDITNKNGLVVIEVPIDRSLKKTWESYDGHVHYFTKGSFQRLVDKFNLKCIYSNEGIQKPAWLFIGEVQ